MRTLRLSESTASLRRVFFVVVDSATGQTLQTGKAGTLAGFITKKGATPVAVAGAFTEVSAADQPGLYYYEASAAELNTIGRAVCRFTCAACVERTLVIQVGAVNEDLALEATAQSIDGKTTNLPTDPADQSAVESAISASEANIIATVPTVAEVDTELSSVHGSGSWETGQGPGSGANAVTVTVEDSVSSNPIPGVLVQVRNSDESVLLASQETDASGEVGFLLDDGTYKVRLRKLGSYTFSNPETLVVSGTTTDTYQGLAFSPSAPPSPDTCIVYGWNFDALGDFKVVEVKAKVIGADRFLQSDPHIVQEDHTVSSAVLDGYWELALTRSVKYTVPGVKYTFTINDIVIGDFEIPDLASKNFKDLVIGS